MKNIRPLTSHRHSGLFRGSLEKLGAIKHAFSVSALIALGITSTAQAALVSYDLSLLDNTTDGTPFNTTMTYPSAYTDGFVVKDPLDDDGRMDQNLRCVFAGLTENALELGPSGSALDQLHYKSYGNGFTGSDVLNTTDYPKFYFVWANSGGLLQPTSGEVFWVGRTNADESDNGTAFNDMAYAFRLTDSGDGVANVGDLIELLGIVYSTESDSVFGKTADELTALLVVPPEPALLISYDLTQLNDDNDAGAQFDTTLVFPDLDSNPGVLSVQDPSDDTGRMDRVYFRYFATDTSKMQGFGDIFSQSGEVGFIGNEILDKDNPDAAVLWNNSAGSAYYLPANGEIAWFGR
jgi:hypothetical protein